MPLSLNTPTAQKAGYILLTAAMFHANQNDTSQLIGGVLSSIARDMTLDTLVESIELVETLVYPRFAW